MLSYLRILNHNFLGCKTEIANIKKLLKLYELIEKIISDILNYIPQLPSNVVEFLTKLKSLVTNRIEVWSSILKSLEKHCNGAVHSIKHQKGKQ